jgi:hypothetical protein
MTLVSYVPKQNKAVILLSSMHDDDKIDDKTKKPEIILYYNSTKFGVDILDQLCVTYTTGIATRRWPLALFYCMLDIIGVNSLVLYSANNKINPIRRLYLKELGQSLIETHMKIRYNKNHMHRTIRSLIAKSLKIDESENFCHEKKDNQMNKRSRCYYCKRAEDKKTNISCDSCNKLICFNHRSIYCKTCDNDCVDDYVK